MDAQSSPGLATGGPSEEPCRSAWREALYDDTLCLLLVVDRDGTILDANRRVRDAFGMETPLANRYRLHDLMPEPVCDERMSLVTRALQERTECSIVGMLWGMMHHSTYRPLDEGWPTDAVMIVSHRIMSPDEMPPVDRENCLRAEHDDLGPLARLTAREIEVLALIGHGYSTSEIAHRLYRSEKTVEWHRASLGQKLGVSNRVQLARVAINAGLTALPEPDMEVVKDRQGEIHVSSTRVRDEKEEHA
jgi:DNA-binding CsgD family transcriptional regulator